MANLHVAKLFCKGKYQISENEFYSYKIKKTEFQSSLVFLYVLALCYMECRIKLPQSFFGTLYISRYLMATVLHSYVKHF